MDSTNVANWNRGHTHPGGGGWGEVERTQGKWTWDKLDAEMDYLDSNT